MQRAVSDNEEQRALYDARLPVFEAGTVSAHPCPGEQDQAGGGMPDADRDERRKSFDSETNREIGGPLDHIN